ncbi:YihY/virulence factor BrkB family protein [Edaphobacter modestus]|uniref:Membrane protein n=1 Tax=Edaphobacter modestus TaxID=388466 RepID=A0A4Q7YXW7_9BACT|nr:YihY/virulence factor BrkB family protein [Edaphobacter modestus]RZU41965.1 membrane protein [Edaphobacter modestus]
MAHSNPLPAHPSGPAQQRVWDYVSRWPLRSLWNLKGVPLSTVARRTWRSLIADNLLGRAAELAFFFLFALFPTLFSASSVLGLAARSASSIYYRLLEYLALVVPTSALGMVLTTFNETTANATSGKLTFGLIAAIWSASVGVSAIQEALNTVYNVRDNRGYFHARVSAIGVTILLALLATLTLAAMLGGDYFASIAHSRVANHFAAAFLALLSRIFFWTIATALLTLCFAVIYFWAPGVRKRRWRWLTPGATIGILAWVLVSLGFRAYLHYFNFYSVTYGSLGAVIILLMWFYITGFTLLLGAEINSEIEAAAAERNLSTTPPGSPPNSSLSQPPLVPPSSPQSMAS